MRCTSAWASSSCCWRRWAPSPPRRRSRPGRWSRKLEEPRMTKLFADQADGLRRLLAHTPTRVVADAAMNLGAALVQQGKDVLVLDEHGATAAAICAAWAIDPLGDLADVADRR